MSILLWWEFPVLMGFTNQKMPPCPLQVNVTLIIVFKTRLQSSSWNSIRFCSPVSDKQLPRVVRGLH